MFRFWMHTVTVRPRFDTGASRWRDVRKLGEADVGREKAALWQCLLVTS